MKLLVFWVKIEDSYEYCIHEVMNMVADSLRGLSFKFCVLALAEMLRCCFSEHSESGSGHTDAKGNLAEY